jgi:hypothetical protein
MLCNIPDHVSLKAIGTPTPPVSPERGHQGATIANVFMQPRKIVKFIIASRHLRNLKRTEEAQVDMLDASFDDLWHDIGDQRTKPPSSTFLRGARPRFDVAMMLMFRRHFETMMRSAIPFGLYLFADGSPASGFESLTVVESMLRQNSITYHRMPMIYLGIGHMGLKAKAFGLLWTFHLELGPSPDMMRFRCWCVRGFCTDKGVEMGLCDLCDTLPQFYEAIGVVVECPRQEFLCPNAFWLPGWHYCLGNILREVLRSIVFFSWMAC